MNYCDPWTSVQGSNRGQVSLLTRKPMTFPFSLLNVLLILAAGKKRITCIGHCGFHLNSSAAAITTDSLRSYSQLFDKTRRQSFAYSWKSHHNPSSYCLQVYIIYILVTPSVTADSADSFMCYTPQYPSWILGCTRLLLPW